MIETAADLSREFDDLRDEMLKDAGDSMEVALERTIEKISAVTPRLTGNAAEAVGVPGPIGASKVSLSGLSSLRDTRARRSGSDVAVTLYLQGMEYFPDLDRKYDLSRVPVDEFGVELEGSFMRGW